MVVIGAIVLSGCGILLANERLEWRERRSREAIVELYSLSDPDSLAEFTPNPAAPQTRSSIAPPSSLGNTTTEPISGFGRSPDLVLDTPISPPPQPVTASPEPADLALSSVDRLTLLSDTDRDGVISTKDLADRDRWHWSRGGFVPVNLDDDDRDGQPDALDRTIQGQTDDHDLAIVRLLLPSSIPDTAKLSLSIDAAARPYVNLFQRTAQGWTWVDTSGNTPIIFSRDVVLGVEGRAFATGLAGDAAKRGVARWDGRITIEAIARDPVSRDPIATDRLQLRVTPWLMPPSFAPVETVYVTDIPATRRFVTQLAAIVEPRGATVVRETVGTLWMQDTMELGYTQTPGGAGFATWQTMPVVLDGVRKSSPGVYAEDRFAKTLLAPNFSLLRVTTPRSLPEADRWLDWYGNLEVSPPVSGFPLGRVYYGRSTASFHPDLIAFLAAQELQAPAVELDTSWLHIRHVDEIIGFLPHPAGGSVATIVSPQVGLEVLMAWRDRGYGGESLTLPNGTKTTVDQLLADRDWVAHNQAIERDHLAVVRGQLRSEFGLSDDRIVSLPVVFDLEGRAVWSNPVNSLWVNGVVVVGDPQLVKVAKIEANQNGGDPVRAAVVAAIAPLGLTVEFIDDGYYQLRSGNVHCATNARRSAPVVPFWRLEGLRVFQDLP
jgi:hypothetical protein